MRSDPPAPPPPDPSRWMLPAPDAPVPERRLHPLSWLFVLLQQLKSFAVPLLVLIVTGRGSRSEWFGLYSVGVLVLISVARYFTYRFRLDPDGIAIRSGVFQTTRRDIPYERIHNVSLHQTVLHRLFGVAELRLESAGGGKAEAEMRVLSLTDAQALETIIRERGRRRAGPAGAGGEAALPAPAATLLALSTAEVVRLGLISNRGLVLVAAALGTLSQMLPEDAFWRGAFRWVSEHLTRDAAPALPPWLLRPAGLVLGIAVVTIVAVVLVRALSVMLALLQFYGFRLEEVGRQLRVERGLLTRIRAHMPRRRIQAWRLRETLLHRWFGRQSLRVDSAGGEAGSDQRGVRDLAPVAEPASIQRLIRHVLQSDAWPPESWRPLHPRAWRRLFVVPSTVVGAATAVLTWRYGPMGLVLLVVIPLLVLRARLWARHAGWAEAGGLVATRTGWLSRSWEFTEVRKLQSLRLTASPMDRRHGMATVWLDTAGVSSRDGVLRIPFLPADEARRLYERLAAGMDESAASGR